MPRRRAALAPGQSARYAGCVLMLSLVVFGVTAWFLGLRVGGVAAGVSFATLIAAQVIPGTAILIYAVHVLWLAGMVYLGPRVSKMVTKPEDRTMAAQARRWLNRGKALGQAFWRSHK
jgi:hypothetical protein